MSGLQPRSPHGAALKIEPARRKVEPAHLRFVEQHGHRMSWQAMAAACGVNQSDLKRAFERKDAPAAKAAEPVKAPPAAPKNLPGIDPLAVLAAIKRGAASAADISDLVQCSPKHATALVSDLKRRGWLAGQSWAVSGWLVTAAGERALLGVTRGPSKPLLLLRMIAEGDVDRDSLARRMNVSPHSVDVYLSRLRHERMLTGYPRLGGMGVTSEGLAALGLGDGGRE